LLREDGTLFALGPQAVGRLGIARGPSRTTLRMAGGRHCLDVICRVLTLDQRAKLLATIGNPGDGSLLGTHGDAIGIAVEAVVRLKLPALINEMSSLPSSPINYPSWSRGPFGRIPPRWARPRRRASCRSRRSRRQNIRCQKVLDAGEGDDVFVSSMSLKVCVFGLSSLLL